MGFGQMSVVRTYQPDDTVIANDSASEWVVNNTYTKVKTLKLVAGIDPTSTFRFKFTLTATDAGANLQYGKIYRNGVAAGSEQVTDTTTNPCVFTEDVPMTNWAIGDEVQLWVKKQNSAGHCSDFKICGLGSEWRGI